MSLQSRPALRTAWVYVDINDPLIAWLVYRGEMVAAPKVHELSLSIWHLRRLIDVSAVARITNAYRLELTLESIRRQQFPESVSRLAGFYAFPNKDSAAVALTWSAKFKTEHLVEIGITDGSRWSVHDSEWITRYGRGDGATDVGWMEQYLAGKACDGEATPAWELLVDGRAMIFGAEVRQAAYETIRNHWKESLALLEVARLAAWLDSDLGLITPLISHDGIQFQVRYAMNMVDAENPDFLRRVAGYDGPKNTNDLTPESEWIVPDLRDREFVFPG